jgi:hypothetical protein
LGHLDFIDGVSLSYTAGDHKMVLAKRPYAKQVFDLSSDRSERRNLLGTEAGDQLLMDLGAAAAELFNDHSRGALRRSRASLNPKLAANLAALGYVSVGAPAQPRFIPRRITVPDSRPTGRLGWEPSSEPSCIEVAEPIGESLLLAGWYHPEAGGRWMGPSASLSLGLPRAAREAHLELRGINYRPTPTRLVVTVEGRPVLNQEIAIGPFQIEGAFSDAGLENPVLLELTTSSAFVPSQHGSADPRTLGLFFTSICMGRASQ